LFDLNPAVCKSGGVFLLPVVLLCWLTQTVNS
jgi:hypothetical protein